METKSRKRGVKASRAKLHAAMLDVGIKTQAALAERIADVENLESAPKDTINRAFRQESVSPNTIARIAKVLKVEAYTLYLSSKELDDREEQLSQSQQSTFKNTSRSASKSGKKPNVVLSTLLTVFLFSIIGYGAILYSSEDASLPSYHYQLPLTVTLVQRTELYMPTLMEDLSKDLAEGFELSESNILKISPDFSPWKLPNKLHVDNVLVVSTKSKGRYYIVTIELLGENTKELVFADVWPLSSVIAKQQEIASKTANRLHSLVGSLAAGVEVYNPPKTEAVEALLNGYNISDGVSDRYHVNQKLVFFERATHFSPNYIKARAAKCSALSDSYIVSNDESILQQAFEECSEIEPRAAGNAEFQFAMGQISRVKGELELAEQYFLKAIKIEEGYLSGHLALAKTYLDKGIEQQDINFLKKSGEVLKQALALDPLYWKTYHLLARLNYMMGNPSKALEYGEKAVEISANLTSLNNLATFHFCSGKMSRAKEIYQQLSTMKYAPAMIKYQLASVYSWYREYPKAIELMESYLSELDRDGEVVALDSLIGIADTYNELKNNPKATEYYKLAFERLEKERLKGDDSLLSQASRLYIEVALSTLGKKSPNIDERGTFSLKLEGFEKQAVNPNLKIRVLFTWILLEDWDKAEVLYHQVAPLCKALAESPVFERYWNK
ncbi:MAG: hypothetical protein KUG78_03135 [Kangiellaceae bacterium]|nr:hypothetical protein [Kangiellaceae bacterium]